MCRIFANESLQTPQEIADWLRTFAKMARESPAPPDEAYPNGYPQKDGWGFSLYFPTSQQTEDVQHTFELLKTILGETQTNVEYSFLAVGIWVFFTSLTPVWEQSEQVAVALECQRLPKAKLLVHARAAHSESDIGNIRQNMPFMMRVRDEILSFAFNGAIALHFPNTLLRRLGLQDLELDQTKNGAQKLETIVAALIEKSVADHPHLTMREHVVFSLDELAAQIRGTVVQTGKEQKIATITGCNIVIQGKDFTCFLSAERDRDAENPGFAPYYSMFANHHSVASATMPGLGATLLQSPLSASRLSV